MLGDWLAAWRVRRRLRGRPLDTVLADAPFEFGHFQGENGYRIWHRDTGDDVYFASSRDEAVLWILDHVRAAPPARRD